MFVGRVAGAQQLAALNPGVTVADFSIFMFLFLSRATTGLVTRALASGPDPDDSSSSSSQRTNAAARAILGCALKVALACGLLVGGLLFVFTAPVLAALGVPLDLRSSAAAYIQVQALWHR
jgi:Na+-driven multidrug efflux pump